VLSGVPMSEWERENGFRDYRDWYKIYCQSRETIQFTFHRLNKIISDFTTDNSISHA